MWTAARPLRFCPSKYSHSIHSFIHHKTRRCALDPDNATVLVVGGDRVGFESVRRLKDLGSWAYMLPDGGGIKTRQLEEMNVVVMKGDLNDSENLKNMFQNIDGLEGIISTLDPSRSFEFIKAAFENPEVQKFVMMSRIGAPDWEEAERALTESDRLDHVIVRVSEMIDEPATDCGIFSEEAVSGTVHVEDVAELLLKALFSDKPTNKILYAADKSKSNNAANPAKQLEPFEV